VQAMKKRDEELDIGGKQSFFLDFFVSFFIKKKRKKELLMTIIQKILKKSWAFSNLVSFCKIYLFNYLHLMNFLENPDKDWSKTAPPTIQYDLF
jgi:hypothetical protein